MAILEKLAAKNSVEAKRTQRRLKETVGEIGQGQSLMTQGGEY